MAQKITIIVILVIQRQCCSSSHSLCYNSRQHLCSSRSLARAFPLLFTPEPAILSGSTKAALAEEEEE